MEFLKWLLIIIVFTVFLGVLWIKMKMICTSIRGQLSSFTKEINDYLISNQPKTKISKKEFFTRLSRSLRKDINKVIMILFYSLLLSTIPFFETFINVLPPITKEIYWFLILSFIPFYIIFLYHDSVSIRLTRILKQLNLLLLFPTFSLFFVCMVFLNAIERQLDFATVLIAIFFIFVPMIYIVKKMADVLNNKTKVVIGITTFLFSEMYMLLVFGIYNASLLPEGIITIKKDSVVGLLFRLIHYGSQNIFQFPAPSPNGNIEPIIQYFVGMTFNLVIVGFFISYFSSLIGNKQKRL